MEDNRYDILKMKISRDGLFKNLQEKTFSAEIKHGDNILLGSLVFHNDTEKSGIFEVNYLDKHVAEDSHSSGYLKQETRKPTKSRTLIKRAVDRSFRPLIKENTPGFQLIIRLLNADQEISVLPAAIRLASDLLIQAGLIDDYVICKYIESEKSRLLACYYKRGITMLEASLDQWDLEQVSKEILDTNYMDHQSLIPTLQSLINKIKESPIGCFQAAVGVMLALYQRSFYGYNIDWKGLGKSMKKYLKIYGEASSKTLWFLFSIFNGIFGRYDGRGSDEIRQMKLDTYVLKRPIGSALVTRGKTKVLTRLTISDKPQSIDEPQQKLLSEYTNVQYDMLPSASGETGRIGMPTGREIGHGNVVYNAVRCMRNNEDHAVYVQNDVISCAGSSSMASVVGTSLAMNLTNTIQGVVSGTTVGCIVPDMPISDIMEVEDMIGLMDLKVAGSQKGITAIQMDVKLVMPGIDMINKSLQIAWRDIQKINQLQLDALRDKKISKWTRPVRPSAKLLIEPEKVRNAIGMGGYNFKRLIKKYQVEINMDKVDGKNAKTIITGLDQKSVDQAKLHLESLTKIPKADQILEAVVISRLRNDVFLIQPDMAISGVCKLSDNVESGETVKVKFLSSDDKGIFYEKITDQVHK